MDNPPSAIGNPTDELYGASYYASHCGTVPYERNDHWLQFFGRVADELVRSFQPRSAFDAGCALGLLVESLWDRGVEATGRDISEFAIGSVRMDVKPFCTVGSIADNIEGSYDLLTCIEVLEHMPEDAALQAIRSMAAAAPRILFASSPTDFDEPTHCNVRPPIYWLARWAEVGFAPLPTHDAGYLAPHAYILERSETGRTPRDVAAFADRIRHRVAMSQLGKRLFEVIAESEDRASELKRIETGLDHALRTLEVRDGEINALSSQISLLHSTHEAEVSSQNSRLLAAMVEVEEKAATKNARILKESSRLRAAAALRAAEARVEAADLRGIVGTLDARARIADSNMATMRACAEQATTQLAALQAESANLRQAFVAAVSQRDALLASTAWRATWPVRRLGLAVPVPVRRAVRRALKTVWWCATGQLGIRMRHRRQLASDIAKLSRTRLFDPAWYAAQNPDVRASGMDPAAHYALAGGREGRDPSPEFCASAYLDKHPEARASHRPALFHFIEVGQGKGWVAPSRASLPSSGMLSPLPTAFDEDPAPSASAPAQVISGAPATDLPDAVDDAELIPPSSDLVKARFRGLEPLRTFAAPHQGHRVTIVTDSINSGSLYGGVGTALILAALLARKLGGGLRLVTRTEEPEADNIGAVLKIHGVPWADNIELIHAPPGAGRDVPVAEKDIFLTTSWWTTWATRQSVAASQIIYLLQEDERGFYPLGDDHLRCSEMLSDASIAYVVNSSLLLAHFEIDDIAPGGVAFEPAFPLSAYRLEHRDGGGKYNFFFYARPNNPRNLFWRGVEAVEIAIEEGILDPEVWNIHFVGKDIPAMRLPGGIRPSVSENMDWGEYATLVRSMDLGLSLMDTPHPSYPPLDLAASGAVVVTNRFGVKKSLEAFSPNIFCVDSTLPAIVAGLRSATTLARDRAARKDYYGRSGLGRDWEVSMRLALDHLASRFGS